MASTATAQGGAATAYVGGRPNLYPAVVAAADTPITTTTTLATVSGVSLAFPGDKVMLSASVAVSVADGVATGFIAWFRGTAAGPVQQIAAVPIPANASGDPVEASLGLDYTDQPGDVAGIFYYLRALSAA